MTTQHVKWCPKCGRQTELHTARCGACAHTFRSVFQAQPLTSPVPQAIQRAPVASPKAPRVSGKLFGAALVILTLGTLGHFLPDTSSKLEAFQFSRDEVREQLKAPSTADFDRYDEQRVLDLGNGEYQVHGFVQAENSFGVPLRQEWLTRVKYLGRNNWTAERLELDGDVIEDDPAPASSRDASMGGGNTMAAEPLQDNKGRMYFLPGYSQPGGPDIPRPGYTYPCGPDAHQPAGSYPCVPITGH